MEDRSKGESPFLIFGQAAETTDPAIRTTVFESGKWNDPIRKITGAT